MSKGADLRLNRSLDLLANLKQTVAKFVKREEQIGQELSARRYSTTRKSQDAIRHTESGLQQYTSQMEEAYENTRKHVKGVYETRRARVEKFRANSLRNLPMKAKEVKQRWMGDLQMKNFLAERKLKTEMEKAEGSFTNFTTKLDVNKQTLKDLELRARKALSGYGALKRMLRRKAAVSPEHFNDLANHFREAEQHLAVFEEFPLPKFFRSMPLPVLLFLALLPGAGLWFAMQHSPLGIPIGGAVTFALWVGLFAVYSSGLKKAKPVGTQVANSIVTARAIMVTGTAAVASASGSLEQDRARIQAEHDRTLAELQQQWGRANQIEGEYETRIRRKMEVQPPRITAKIDQILGRKLDELKASRERKLGRYTTEALALKEQYTATYNTEAAAVAAEEKTKWDEATADWKKEITPLYAALDEMNASAKVMFPAWDQQLVETWKPATEFTPATKFAHLDVDLAKQPGGLPKDPRLALPGPAQISLPLAITYPDQGSVLFETNESGGGEVTGILNNIILRLLATTPPGKLSFTIIDPVGLGESFAGLMHLSDYEESIINRRIWTQRDQIEERLAELSEHIEKVIQMYLRNEYATITEYNEQAGSVAEKYHFLVVADFPANFSEIAAKRLQSIAASGPRCGIFTLIHWDQRQPLPDGFVPAELRKSSICFSKTGPNYTLARVSGEPGATLAFDTPPDPELAVTLSHKIGKASIDSNRVEVPFLQIAPKPEEMWTNSTTNELKVAVGRTGATKFQYLAIGKGTRQHALFAGKTGSGKSTLFHVIITNLALWCSPDEVEFYLIDFKKGVEFKCYATKHLPHAKVVAIESDREFALSVLQRVDAELRRRGDLFRKLGVQDVAGYKREGGTEPMPRSLLLIDEFQEFFVEDDIIAQTASLLFDRIVRQGRAFGIHVLLGSQTLGGAYSLARATLGQMVIRVALQCNEADAYLIMDENNSAPRLLSRPGEGIYNDSAGAIEGNSPFQVVWLSDEERDQWLEKVTVIAGQHHDRKYPGPIVFEGNAPANITDNELLIAALDAPPAAAPYSGKAWLGAPNSIKGPTEAAFARQSGSNMLIIGQREESALTMMGMSMLALSAQYPAGTAKFVLLHAAPPGSPEANFMESVVAAIPHEVTIARGQDIAAAINTLAAELKSRSETGEADASAPAIFLFIHDLQRYKKLRAEDDFSFSSSSEEGPSASAQFNELMTEGASHGIHIIATVDTFNNVNRFINRKALTEFEMRVLFQMSANDSASLIDSPKASTLGLHRAIFFNEREGVLETFRPYAMPDADWIKSAAAKLAGRTAPAAEKDVAGANA
ncbi:MAG TPA: FtsK/SpoIIIE domain-containing protein [Chthoniobacteraceae bacterium]|nr:FtsK/SpoIIIE domain-containing protein [Chthoniobacteraceae bacterium]